MKSGISILPNTSMAKIIEVVSLAEALGFDRCWVNDEGANARDVFVVLAALAQNTSRIALGTGVTNPYTRHPGVTAASISSVDELSGGRAFLGIGAGGNYTLNALGIERRKPLSAVREMVHFTRLLMSGKRVSHDGESASIHAVKLNYHRSDLEIWIAGRGPKMVALAGEMADGFAVGSIHRDVLSDVIATVRRSAKDNRRKTKVCYSAFFVFNEAMLNDLRPMLTFSLIDTPAEIHSAMGIDPAEIRALHQNMRLKGLAEASRLIKPEWADPYILRGNAVECAGQLVVQMKELAMDEFMVPITNWADAKNLLYEISQTLESTNQREGV